MQLKRPALWLCAAMAAALAGCGGSGEPALSGDPEKAADQRAERLLAQMTVDEKVQMVHGVGRQIGPLGGAGYIPGIPRLGIPDYYIADSTSGVHQRLNGVPVANHATALPSPLALAASWDEALAYDYGAHIASELRTAGFTEGLGGSVNLARELRSGRTFENLGEDPVLAGRLASARTRATQDGKVVATIKHFVANDQETNRYTSNSVVDERTLRQMHLLPFEIAIKESQPGNLMCAYNLVNGQKACENRFLLTDVLKTEWGFKGKVQTDWVVALTDTVRGAQAGLDEEQPGSTDDEVGALGFPSHFNQRLKAALAAGTVPMARLDDMVLRKLRTLYRVGIMDSPARPGGRIDTAAGDAAALRVAQQSMVLLKNGAAAGDAAAVLPLDAAALRRVVVVGGHADAGVLSGGGSGSTPARDGNAVACLDPGALIGGISPGCATWYKSAPLDAIRARLPNATVAYFDGSDAAAAAAAAASADVAIVFGTQWATEHRDLPSLDLPSGAVDPANYAHDQNALIAAVAAQARRTVVVLESGSAVTMPWLDRAHAVLAAWYPGMQGGPAIAGILFGEVNPSGKLPITFPRADSDQPQKAISKTDLQVVYREGLEIGYRWYDAQGIAPLFPFGHGLSYTRFAYSGLTAQLAPDGSVTVGFTLRNAGTVAGAEVAQVYAALPADAGEPPRRLIGWQKVRLAPGQSQAVRLSIRPERLGVWDTALRQWKIPAGTFGFEVGGSSRDPEALKASRRFGGASLAAVPAHAS